MYITTNTEMTPYFSTFLRKSTHMERYKKAIANAYDKYGDAQVPGRGIVNQILTPEIAPFYPDHSSWYFTASGSSAFQAVLAAVTDPGETVHHPVWGWCALPGVVMLTGRKLELYGIESNSLDSWIDLDWLRQNHSSVNVLVIVHLWGNIHNLKEVREIVGPDTIIIEDIAQCPSIGENMEFETGKYSDFLIFSFGMFKTPGSIEEGGAMSFKDDKYAEFFEAYFSNGITRELISNTEVMAPIDVGTKEYMSIAEAAAVKEDIAIMKEYGTREQRTRNALAFYDANGYPPAGLDNNKIYFNCPIAGIGELTHAKLWDAKVQIRELPDFHNVYNGGPRANRWGYSTWGAEYPDWRQAGITVLPCHEYITDDQRNMICDILSGA